jgi:polygalacturonase
VAIVQISQITNRKGIQVDLPQLAGAELGWSIDERRLFIGNGTLQEGAPVIGNTEILTEFSDILAFQTNYTYKGAAAGYVVQTGPTPSTPVTQSLQSWLDQFATVKDFGAVGDGVADDTEAINRALYQLYCREINPQIRRSLFFPAGVYRVTETILIPSYAMLWGEGADSSVIYLDVDGDDSTLNAYVARTADSLQQYGVNIGTNGASAPENIVISNMGFQNRDTTTDVFLVEDATNCRFQNVGFFGPLTTANLITAANDTAGLRFASTSSLVTTQCVFDGCQFSGTTFGINTDQQVKGITVANSYFNTLYQGILLGTGTVVNGGATGFKIISNTFDNIYAEGIIFGDVELNASGHNIFYDVGNHFQGTINPYTSIIDIQSDNNVSISDLFERSDAYATTDPRIKLNNTTSIGITNSSQLALGTYVRESGQIFTLVNNTGSPATITTVDATTIRAFCINYSITRNLTYRTGTVTVTTDGSATLNYSDDYVENTSTGINLDVSQSGSTVSFTYTSTNTGFPGTLSYSITHLA